MAVVAILTKAGPRPLPQACTAEPLPAGGERAPGRPLSEQILPLLLMPLRGEALVMILIGGALLAMRKLPFIMAAPAMFCLLYTSPSPRD